MEINKQEKNLACPVCHSAGPFIKWEAKERMLGMMDEFCYCECPDCQSIWLSDPPADMGKYYPKEYYSFGGMGMSGSFIRNLLKRLVIQARFRGISFSGIPGSSYLSSYLPWLLPEYFDMNRPVLDLGCGAGFFLQSMANAGFLKLKGLDPYNAEPTRLPGGVSIDNRDIFSEKGKFHGIMLHHSFEHMDAPLEVLKQAHNILEDDGFVLIRIPVAESLAWEKYGPLWVQLDAPRHYFIHSRKGLDALFRESGFRLDKVVYDSYSLQYWGSELYKQGKLLSAGTGEFDRQELERWDKMAADNNRQGRGDQACFYLRKN